MPPFRLLPLRLLSPSLAATLLLTGCANDTARRERAREAMLEQVRNAPPVLDTEESFFDGQIIVAAQVGPGFGAWRGRGGRGRGGLRGFSENEEGEDREPNFATVVYQAPDENPQPVVYGPRQAESPLPPVRLRLRLENTTSQPLEVEFLEVNSALGNFAVYPAKLTIPPGEAVEPTPMTSRLGITATEIPLTVALRLGNKSDKHVLTLTPVASAPPPQGKSK